LPIRFPAKRKCLIKKINQGKEIQKIKDM